MKFLKELIKNYDKHITINIQFNLLISIKNK